MRDLEIQEAEDQLDSMDVGEFCGYLYRVAEDHAASGKDLTATDYRMAARRINYLDCKVRKLTGE